MKKISLLVLLFCTYLPSLRAQLSLALGYNGAVFGNVANMRNEAFYLNNYTYKNLENPFKFNNFFQGAQIELIVGEREAKQPFYFWSWTNQFNYMGGSGMYNNADFKMTLSYRFNNFTFMGFGYYLTDKFAVSISPATIGLFKVFYKSTLESDPKEKKEYHNVDKGIISSYNSYGSALYLDYYIHKNLRFRIQGYYDWFGVQLRDRTNITFVYNYRASSISASLAFVISKRD